MDTLDSSGKLVRLKGVPALKNKETGVVGVSAQTRKETHCADPGRGTGKCFSLNLA